MVHELRRSPRLNSIACFWHFSRYSPGPCLHILAPQVKIRFSKNTFDSQMITATRNNTILWAFIIVTTFFQFKFDCFNFIYVYTWIRWACPQRCVQVVCNLCYRLQLSYRRSSVNIAIFHNSIVLRLKRLCHDTSQQHLNG